MVQDTSAGASAVMTQNGDMVMYNSGRARLPKGSDGNVLTQASGLPSWAEAGGSSIWTELVSLYDQSAVDTGYVDMGTYRWLDIWVSGYLSSGSGTDGFLLQFYDPDESLAGGSHYTSSGMFDDTHYVTGSGADIPLTFDQAVTADRPFFFNMRVTCSPVDKAGGGASMFSWMGSHRYAPNASYWSGAGLEINGWTDTTTLQFCNGIKLIEGNTYQDCIISIYGAGVNTS